MSTSQRGFTLVEVLVALVIVALVLGAGLRAAGALATAQQTVARRALAGWSADNRLAELRLGKVFPVVGHASLTCPQAGLALICNEDVTTTANGSIRRVKITVVLDGEGDSVLIQRVGFVSRFDRFPE